MKQTALILGLVVCASALSACADIPPEQAEAQAQARAERGYTLGSNIPRGEHSNINNTTDVSTDSVYGRPTAPKGQGG